MAIEPKPMGEEGMEEMDMEVSEEMPTPTGEETVTLSLDMLGGKSVKPGDRVQLEVVSVSDEDGTLQVRYAQPKPKGGGIAEAAAVFDEG
jgi:hypothetical protein